MKNLRPGLLAGALTGLLYGLIEYAFVILEPMYRWGPRSLGPEHWFWETLFLAIYLLSGAAVGVIAAALSKTAPQHAAPRAVVAAGLIILLIGRLNTTGFSPAAAILDLALASVAILSLRALAGAGAAWLFWLSSPWLTIPLVFGMGKLAERPGSAVSLVIGCLGIGIAAMVAALAASSLRLRQPFVPVTTAVCAVLLGGMILISLRLNAAPALLRGTASAAAAGRPNVLFIVLDTVRADHLSLYGYGRRNTSNLENLAREGVLFRNAISAADMTLSSYGAMYTSQYPSWHRALPNAAGAVLRLDPSFDTLAETLSSHGYDTSAVLANHGYLNREFGMQQGFRYYDVRPVAESCGPGHGYWLRHAIRPALDLVLPTGELDRLYRRADQITNDAVRILASRNAQSAPLFLSLNYMDAHEPYLPPGAYRNLFSDPGAAHAHHGGDIRGELASHKRSPQTEAVLKDLIAQYDGSVAYMDAEIKRVLDALKWSGLYDNTLIIVTSDHGEALGERDDLGHPVSVHQELVHVPLLIKYPRSLAVPPGQQVANLASGVDLMPTILDIAGVPSPAGLQGHSLRNPEADPDRFVISESFVDAHLVRIQRRTDHGQRGLYQGPWKLIATDHGATELYNWTTDPGETQNLHTPDQPEARRLTAELDHWLQLVPRLKTTTKRMDQQTMERLRGLGYIR